MATRKKTFSLYIILIVGKDNVGKTYIFNRFCSNIWINHTLPTIGFNVGAKVVNIDGKKVELTIYDCSRHKIRHLMCKGIHCAGFLLVYDVTDKDSFDSIRDWISYIKKDAPGDVEVMIVGNKCDLEERRVVSKERGQLLANEYGYNFMEISASSGHNVTMAFMNLARTMKDSKRKQKRRLWVYCC